MNCIIPGHNVKIFSKAIHSLAKIGTELFIEPNINNFAVRTINCNKSAFASFIFQPDFFTEYNVTNDIVPTLNSDDFDGKCKVSIKSCLGIFKNIKQVEFCKIYVNSNIEKLMIELKCRLDTKKIYAISVIDIESLQSSYDSTDAKNKVSGKHNIFAEIANGFQMSEEEITLEPTQDSLLVKNYVEGSIVNPKFMRTELTFKADEFKSYEVNELTSITFCLREFRAFLNFAETTNMDFRMCFDAAGEPVVFTIEDSEEFKANLVMSTLSPDDITFMEPSKNITIKEKLQNKVPKEKPIFVNINNSCRTSHSDMGNISEDINLDHFPTSVRRTSNETMKETTEEFDVTFRNTENIDENIDDINDCIQLSPNCCKQRKPARSVFTRCFKSTYIPDFRDNSIGNKILAVNSDEDEE